MDNIQSISDNLRRRAEIIRDETNDSANTAERVGQLFIDIIETGSSLEIIESKDEETIPTDYNIYSALKSKLEDEKQAQEMEGKFIRKDKPDYTDYLLGLNGGATFGNYVGGFAGSGGIIDEKGYGELMGLKLREFLEVPELRFNRIDVVSGELWNAVAFGLIESVDETNKIVKLKLEEGELSGLHVNDFCRGIFHNITGNAEASGKDSAGFEVMQGFSTAYFTPVEIIDTATFHYELKPGSIVHPCKAMKFAVYGNPVDANRQASAYHTRTYTRYLRNVSTWEINPGKHVSMQLGDLSNLVIDGERLTEGSVYLNNVYFGGNIWTVGGLDNGLKGQDAYSVTLSTYSAVYNSNEAFTEQVDVVSGNNTVVTGADIVIASNFRISTRIQALKGATPLRYSTVMGEGKYLVSATGDGCTFTITDGMLIVHGVTAEKAVINISVNCEGLVVHELEFTVVSVTDGIDGTDIEWIYKRTATEGAKPAKPISENINDFVPSGWTDDPVGVSIDMPYEWSCKREKKGGVWSEYSEVFLWLKFGKDGKEIEYIYRLTMAAVRPSTPETSQTDDFVPSGWADDPVGPSSSYPYEWVSVRKKSNGLWGVFSLPSLFSKYSFDGTPGAPGADGMYYEDRYRISSTQPGTPTGSFPSGWSLDPPTGSGQIWVIRAKFTGDGHMFSNWSVPVKWSGAKGDQGEAGPAMTYRDLYDANKYYVGNSARVDAVRYYHMGTYKYFVTLPNAGIFKEVVPTNTTKWRSIGDQFESIATGFAFIESALIAGWRFKENYIESQNSNVVLDGNANAGPRIALGANYANRNTAPTRLYDTGEVYFQKGVFGGYLQIEFVELSFSDATIVSNAGGRTMYKLNKNLNVIGLDNDGVVLPSSWSYEGAIATIHNMTYPPYTKSFYATQVQAENGYGIGGINRLSADWFESNDPASIYLRGEVVQFLAVKAINHTGGGGYYIKWVALNYKK